MSEQGKPTSLPRRDFLKRAGLTTGVAAGAAVAMSAGSAKAATPDQAPKGDYQETDHVRKYYELAKF